MSENWIDLSDIPKYKGIGTRGKYANDWSNAIGHICRFCCDDIKGYFTIKKYDKEHQKVTIEYNGNFSIIPTSYILGNNLKSVIGLRTKNFKVEIGEEFVDENRNIKITGRKFVKDKSKITRKIYDYTCNVCGWDKGEMDECHLLNGIGCSCCAKTIIVPYINDVYTTNPEYIKCFKNIEDTHKTTSCSKKEFIMVCPFCGNEQLYSTEKLSTYGFSCKKCGDGISYGEKFVYSLLEQIRENFITQLSHTTFDWCDKYKYDFYLPRINTIIEVHGRQHYFDKKSAKSELYGYCHDNDVKKEKLAKENGIANYIIIDCRESNLQYIKNSIINSGLLNLLDVSGDKINWLECDRFTSKSFLTYVCEYKNDHPELSSRDIGKVFHMARTTIQSYLQKGANLGICIYDKEFERKFKTKEAREKHYNAILYAKKKVL